MRRLGLVLAATLSAVSTAEARRSSPQATSDDLQPAGGTLIPRAVLLGVANGVNLAGTSIVAYEMATGKKALAATALSVLVSVPTVAYLVTEIRSDPKDVLLYGTAAWSAALLTKGVIDLIRHHDPESQRSNERVIIQPMFDPSHAKPAIGLDFIGSF